MNLSGKRTEDKAKTAGPRSAGLRFFFGPRVSPRPFFRLPAKERVYGRLIELREGRQRLCVGPHHAGPAGGDRRVPHVPYRLGPGALVRVHYEKHGGLPVPEKGRAGPRQQPVTLPGGDHRPGRHRGHRQHRRGHRGHLHRRAGGRVLDVGVRLLRHVHQIRRNRPGSEVPGHWLQRRPQGRAHVLH